ncbi:hypothetical protein OG21DRAFT_529928 [Imleria badia]|nr:hypothetical protein OG21DRAFT_529928 [Imleria badia]
MVLKSASVLSCLLPARLGFGPNHKPDPPPPARCLEKHAKVAVDRLGDPEFDPFRLSVYQATDPESRSPHADLSRARANTVPSDSLPPPLLIPDGGIGESPSPLHRSLVPSVRPKRSSFTTFFAFSSKRRSAYGAPIIHLPQLQQDSLVPPQAVPGRWVSDNGQTPARLINPGSIPSPLRADEEEYYYSYAALTPISPNQDAIDSSPSKHPSLRQQDLTGHPDLDSQLSSPLDSHPTHTQIRHPYAYSTPLKPYSKTIHVVPTLRHATSQPFHNQDSHSGGNAGLTHGIPSSQPELKTSMSTPNLATAAAPIRLKSLIRKKPPTRSKTQECWLSAETWWDALFSPSPRFKIKQAPRPNPAPDGTLHSPVSPVGKPVHGGPNRNLGVSFPSVFPARPRAVSVMSATSNNKPPSLTRSQSAVDLSTKPSTSATPRAGFEPALETLVDQPTPPLDQAPGSDSELPLPDPLLSLEQVLDEGEAFEQQRAQWKQQASKSLGNKHTRSISRARSKSLGERQARLRYHTPEGSKAQLNFEFLAARTLLGSQSTMPTVHVTKPSSASSHSKAYSHSHSHSAYSYTHSSHSRAYSHSHSHSLTTSNSSKSPRAHSRHGSWSKTTFWKAGSLCGFRQDDSHITSDDEKIPSSSRVEVQGVIYIGEPSNAEGVPDASKASPSPSGEVGIAISSSPPLEGPLDHSMSGPRHQEDDRENRGSSKHTHKSSEYAGPHPSAIDSNLPQLGIASHVSLRHRLPPRAITHPSIAPIVHPYRSATAGNKRSGFIASKVTVGQEATGSTPYPHISLSHADFEQYGVGEALVYASLPRPEKVPETEQASVQSGSLPATELPSPQEQSPSCNTVGLQSEARDSSSLAMNSVPSLTNSTIQMVMSAFDNPDDLDEFQDLFYKPYPAAGGQHWEPSVAINQVPTDVHSSTSSSPLAHLVRKLSEEVNSRRDPPRTPSDPTRIQRSGSQDQTSIESGSKFVFVELARSSSPPPMASTSQLHMPIQEGGESSGQSVMVIPEDVHSSCTSSVMESPLDHEHDTFGYPVKHGQLEAVTAPSPIQSPTRVSTHLSIQEDDVDDDDTAFLSPVTKRFGLTTVDAVRASYLTTTSDISWRRGGDIAGFKNDAARHELRRASVDVWWERRCGLHHAAAPGRSLIAIFSLSCFFLSQLGFFASCFLVPISRTRFTFLVWEE